MNKTKINCKLKEDFCEFRDCDFNGDREVEINVDGVNFGYFHIEKIVGKIENGFSKVNLQELKDGEYSPTIYSDKHIYKMQKIRKTGNSLSPALCDEQMLEKILLRLEKLEDGFKIQSKEVKKHHDAIYGNKIF